MIALFLIEMCDEIYSLEVNKTEQLALSCSFQWVSLDFSTLLLKLWPKVPCILLSGTQALRRLISKTKSRI